MAKNIERPFSVTLVMVYAAFIGLLNIGLGIFTLVDRNDSVLIRESLHSPAQLTTAGIIAIVFGSIQLLLAAAVGQGNNLVRMLFAVVAAFNLAVGAWGALALSGEQRVTGVFAVVFAVLTLFLLFNKKADEYFEQANS
jgi:hypothetical protein